MDKTLKMPVYNDGSTKTEEPQVKAVKERDYEFELAKRDALLEEERSKSMDLLKTIVQLRESLKQEQIKTSEIVKKAADIENLMRESSARDQKELSVKTAQLDEEMKRSHELMRSIEQLKDTIKQEQAKKVGGVDLTAALEAKTKEAAALDAKVKELNATLGKIAGIAAAGKLVGEV
jgi:predicted  nucleic acid-binding Zn-ribbon protein